MKLTEKKSKYKGLKPRPQFPNTINELLHGPALFPNFGSLPDRTNTEFVRSREFAQLLADPFQDGDERSQTERRLEEVQRLNREIAQQQNIFHFNRSMQCNHHHHHQVLMMTVSFSMQMKIQDGGNDGEVE